MTVTALVGRGPDIGRSRRKHSRQGLDRAPDALFIEPIACGAFAPKVSAPTRGLGWQEASKRFPMARKTGGLAGVEPKVEELARRIMRSAALRGDTLARMGIGIPFALMFVLGCLTLG